MYCRSENTRSALMVVSLRPQILLTLQNEQAKGHPLDELTANTGLTSWKWNPQS